VLWRDCTRTYAVHKRHAKYAFLSAELGLSFSFFDDDDDKEKWRW
jgi:hypothetical protein